MCGREEVRSGRAPSAQPQTGAKGEVKGEREVRPPEIVLKAKAMHV